MPTPAIGLRSIPEPDLQNAIWEMPWSMCRWAFLEEEAIKLTKPDELAKWNSLD
jgi:hypothetical protein